MTMLWLKAFSSYAYNNICMHIITCIQSYMYKYIINYTDHMNVHQVGRNTIQYVQIGNFKNMVLGWFWGCFAPWPQQVTRKLFEISSFRIVNPC